MADDTQKNPVSDTASKKDGALQNDIAGILATVKLPETESEKLSKAMNSLTATPPKDIAADVGLTRPGTPDIIAVSGDILSPKPVSTTPSPTVSPVADTAPIPKNDIVFTDTPLAQAVPPQVSAPDPHVKETAVLMETGTPLVADETNQNIAAVVAATKLPERPESVHMSGDRPLTPPVTTVMPSRTDEQTIVTEKPSVTTPKPSAPKEHSIVTPLRTLKEDMNTVVEGSKVSIIRAAALEEEKRAKAAKSAPALVEVRRAHARVRHIAGMLFAIFMLFGIGGAALFGVYTLTQLQQGIQTRIPGQSSDILFAEHTLSLNISGQTPEQVKQIIAQARAGLNGQIGSITRIVPVFITQNADGTQTQTPATFGQFLQALGTKAPDELARALNQEFFFGIHTIDKNVPIFVIPVVSYGRAFESMLTWETTMNADLVPSFSPVPTMTRDENDLPVPRVFQNAVLNNYDVRKLSDDDANIVLYYSFPTTRTLIIAESPYSFVEIISRLQAARKL